MKFGCRNGHTWRSERFQPQPWERTCPECGTPADPTLKAKSTTAGKLRSESPAETAARQRFREIVCAWPCWARENREGHRCRGPVDPHHLIPADHIRRTYGDLPEPDLLDILYAPVIGAPVCRGLHEALENRSALIYFEELEDDLIHFCKRIDARYPGRPSMLARLELESPRREEAVA